MTIFKLTPKQVRGAVIECMEANLVPFITSSPGLGKSAIVAQIAKDFSLTLIDLRLSQCAPEDLMGLPMKDGAGNAARSRFVPFSMFPLEGDPVPGNGWILFLDEFNSASKMVQAAAYKLALDRMVGQAKLHPNCFVVAAGNLATDRAIVNPLSTAMQSRVIHIEMEVSHPDFMSHAVKADYDHRILGFLEFQPGKLHSFKPDHQDRTFACPRTWEFASRLIKDKPFDKISLPLLAGTLSDGVAKEFHAFMQEYSNLPSYSAIVADPANLLIPSSPSTRYALVTMLLDKFDASDFKHVAIYIRRLPPEFQVIYFRGVEQRYPKMRREEIYRTNVMHLTRFISGDDDDDPAAQAA